METNDLTQYPLATLYAWRQPLFLGKQGATEDAAERRVIRNRVMNEMRITHQCLDVEDFADLI